MCYCAITTEKKVVKQNKIRFFRNILYALVGLGTLHKNLYKSQKYHYQCK